MSELEGPLAVRVSGDSDGGDTAAATRVFIIEDNRVFADVLSARLDLEEGITVVGAVDPSQAADRVIAGGRPDVVVIDFDVHSEGIGRTERTIREMLRRNPSIGVVAVIDDHDPKAAVRAVRAGVRAIVPRTEPLSEVVEAVRALRAGESRVPPRLLTPVLESLARPVATELHEPLSRLTPRELDVLRELAAGHDRQMIGERLSISVNTLRTHVKHILDKLGVHSTLNAVTVAMNAGLQPRTEHPVAARPKE